MDLNKSNVNFTDLFDTINGVKTFPFYVLVYLVIYSVSSIIGVFGNALVVVIIATNRKMNNGRNAFIANLGVADFIVSLVTMPASIIGVIMGKQWHDLRPGFCHLVAIICAPTCIASMHSIAGIAISRYFYIAKFSEYQKYFTRNKIMVYIMSTWFLGFIAHFPNYLGWGQIRYTIMLRYCSPDFDYFSYSMFYASFQVMAINLAFFFYLKIYLVLRKSKLSKSMIVGKGDKNKNDLKEKKKLGDEVKIMKATFSSFMMFVFSCFPGAVLLFVGVRDDVPNWVYLYAGLISHGNSTLNFLIYFCTNDMFRTAAKQILFGSKFELISTRIQSIATNASVVPKNAAKTIQVKSTKF